MKPQKLISKYPPIIVIIFLAISVDVVRSEPSSIRLPSQDDGAKTAAGDVCAGFTGGSCPVNCFRADPVCGDNGVTYWCGCPDAACAGARVAKLGHCEIGNSGSRPLLGQALLLIHMVWLIVLGFSVLLGLF